MKRRWALWAECSIGARSLHDGMYVEKLKMVNYMLLEGLAYLLKGFFFRNMNTVSINSMYLVR